MLRNPQTYDKFKEDRYQLFYNLISGIHHKPAMKIVDLSFAYVENECDHSITCTGI